MLLPIVFRIQGTKDFPFRYWKPRCCCVEQFTITVSLVNAPTSAENRELLPGCLCHPPRSALKLCAGIEAPSLLFRTSYLFGNLDPGVHVSRRCLMELYWLWPARSVCAVLRVVTSPEQQNNFSQPKVCVRCRGLGLPGCGAYSEPLSVLPSIKNQHPLSLS